jgi:uncharacterized CHY-type Zn-finger protein
MTGIDYGNGKTNIDRETGIRYGVISMHDVLQAWADSSEPFYPCFDCDGCEPSSYFYPCFDCDQSIEDGPGEDCDGCEPSIEDGPGEDCDGCEPSSYFYEGDGYLAETCLDTDIIIAKSPFFAVGDFCSPCVPGAIDLNSPCHPSEGEKAYCFGHDWFEGGKAPYRVFSVETGKEVIHD